ncbi:hypothetical protein KQX54_015711 [Cotesia glomerata]|uniref:ATP-dependent DNA helicase n=2 Tax=Cotesia glomerata TaxID=32391 RepID=A0AAV7J8X3_COTGL|nr:hypothetical protein KQX54_015711 [Cotesia glomerata]
MESYHKKINSIIKEKLPSHNILLEVDGRISIPDNLGDIVDDFTTLTDKIYPDINKIGVNYSSWLKERAILTPTNDSANSINNFLLEKLSTIQMKYVYCEKKNSKSCPVRGVKILNNPIKFSPSMRHNHAYDLLTIDVKSSNNALIASSKKHFYSIDDIYFNVSKSHVDEIKTRLPLKILKPGMRYHQKKMAASLPMLNTYGEVVDFLTKHISLTKYSADKLITLRNVGDDVLLLGDPGIAASCQFDTLHMSSTINVLLTFGNTRILTFILGQYEHYAFLIGIVLWARQTAEICTEILRQIKFFLLPSINLSKIYVDFDLKIFVKEVFPESNIHGTYNNYCRILYHESYEKNVRIVNPSHEEFLKICFSLILLPHEKIEKGFNELVNNLTHDANVQLTNFIGYFRTTWIQGTAASYQVDHYHDILHHVEAMEDEQLDIYPQLPEEIEAEVHDNDDQEGIENVEFADYDIENEVVENEDEDIEESGDDEIPQDRYQICIKGPREIIVHPCCHYRMCQVCSKKVQKTAQEKRLPLKCPFCNELAQMFCRVF